MQVERLFPGSNIGKQEWRKLLLFEEPAAYQLVGEVMAHQGFDG